MALLGKGKGVVGWIGVEELFYGVAMKQEQEVRVYGGGFVYFWEGKEWKIVRFGTSANGKYSSKAGNKGE